MSRAPHRRPVLLFAAAVAALSLLLPAAVTGVAHAQSMPLPPVVGNYTAGDADGQFSSPRGIEMYDDGTIVVADTGNHRIQVFHPNGTFAFKFGSQGNGTGQFMSPVGLSLVPGTRWIVPMIAVADTGNHRIQFFHPNGTYMTKMGYPEAGDADGQFSSPMGVDVTNARNIVVADTGNHRIQVFLPNGSFAYKFGSQGNGTGQFESPRSVAFKLIDYDIYVADTGNNRVQRITQYQNGPIYWGEFARMFGSNGTGNGQFNAPSSIDHNGFVHHAIADTGNHRIQVVTLQGRLPVSIGSQGTADGQFMSPEGVAMNLGSAIAVADTGNHRVQVFWPNHTLRFIIGSNGTADPPPTPQVNGTADPPPTPQVNGTADPPPTPQVNGTADPPPTPQVNGTADPPPTPQVNGTADPPPTPQVNGTADPPPTPQVNGTADPPPTPQVNGTADPPPTPQVNGTADPPPTPQVNGTADPPPTPQVNGTADPPPTPQVNGTADPPPTPAPDTCSIGIGDMSLDMAVVPGAASPPVVQTVSNTGSLIFRGVGIDAMSWYIDPVGGPPYDEDHQALPPSLTELSVEGPDPRTFVALSVDGMAPAPLAAGLAPGAEMSLWFRINMGGYAEQEGGTLVQHVAYVAECVPPMPHPPT